MPRLVAGGGGLGGSSLTFGETGSGAVGVIGTTALTATGFASPLPLLVSPPNSFRASAMSFSKSGFPVAAARRSKRSASSRAAVAASDLESSMSTCKTRW